MSYNSEVKIFAESDSYVQILQKLYELNKNRKPFFTYEYIAKKISLRSKSNVREIIKGQRKFPVSKISSFAGIFGLNHDLSKQLEYHILLFSSKDESARSIYKKYISHFKANTLETLDLDSFENHPEFPFIYAALNNNLSDVSTVFQKINKTFSKDKMVKILNFLNNAKVLKFDGKTIELINPNIDLGSSGKSLFLEKFYRKSLELLIGNLDKGFNQEQCFYFNSAIQINTENFEEFKEELRAYLMELIIKFETPSNGQVYNLLLGVNNL